VLCHSNFDILRIHQLGEWSKSQTMLHESRFSAQSWPSGCLISHNSCFLSHSVKHLRCRFNTSLRIIGDLLSDFIIFQCWQSSEKTFCAKRAVRSEIDTACDVTGFLGQDVKVCLRAKTENLPRPQPWGSCRNPLFAIRPDRLRHFLQKTAMRPPCAAFRPHCVPGAGC
jgi:hypothetical protein